MELGERLRETVLHTDTLTEAVVEWLGEAVAQPLPLGDCVELPVGDTETVAQPEGDGLPEAEAHPLADCVPLPHEVLEREPEAE